jgi:hypothetical protein
MRASRLLTLLNQHDRALVMANAALQRVKPTDIRRKEEIQGLQEAAMIAKLRHEENYELKYVTSPNCRSNFLHLSFKRPYRLWGSIRFTLRMSVVTGGG